MSDHNQHTESSAMEVATSSSVTDNHDHESPITDDVPEASATDVETSTVDVVKATPLDVTDIPAEATATAALNDDRSDDVYEDAVPVAAEASDDDVIDAYADPVEEVSSAPAALTSHSVDTDLARALPMIVEAPSDRRARRIALAAGLPRGDRWKRRLPRVLW